jgi:CheY-like chemotaxis protein
VKKRILLAEDNEDMARLICHVLEICGYEITIASDGLEAVEAATSGLPDLIIMDIQMPKMDGLEAVSRIRANPKTQALPILAATVKAAPEDREDCLASGCDSYIAKPFTRKELRSAVETLLEKPSSQGRSHQGQLVLPLPSKDSLRNFARSLS